MENSQACHYLTWHPPLASTVNCRKCSVKPGLNQNAMIWLLPIFHSWKSPQTGDLCHASKNAGLWRGGYKRGLPGWRSLQGAGLFLSRAGLFVSRAGLFWPHHWIQRISRIYVLQSAKPTKTLPRMVVYNSGDLLGDVIWKCEDRQTTSDLNVFLSTFAECQCS